MTARILQGSVFDRLPEIEPGSIDCCVSSPPYWQLRSYLPKGHALKPLELGSEKTPAEFVANMVRVYDLVRECLAEHGTAWVNIGDTYSAGQRVGHGTRINNKQETNAGTLGFDERPNPPGLDSGSLCLIPQRLAIALQDAGWIVRSVVVWHKPAPMPASMTGWAWRRCRVKTKEGNGYSGSKGAPRANGTVQRNPDSSRNPELQAQWQDCPGCKKCEKSGGYVLRRGSWRPTSSYEPILMLAKSSSYFADGEPVKTPAAYPDDLRRPLGSKGAWLIDGREQGENGGGQPYEHDATTANLRDVWRIAAEPLSEKHYAAYPTELVRRCLQSSVSAKGYCPACGAPWVRIVDSDFVGDNRGKRDDPHPNGSLAMCPAEAMSTTKTIGWRQSCACSQAEPRRGRVLDPFCGSGRTGITAARLGMDFVGVELNPEYAAMSERLLRADSPLFAEVIP